MSSVIQDQGKIFFLNGGAGTGKTFLYNTIAGKCRSLGHIVICVASSGIASLLLVGGRTAHSTFCLPLDVLPDSTCNVTKQSIHAQLFRETKLIIWDEVPMQNRYIVEAVDRCLRDVCDIDRPFGGITVVFGGDFRQTLPVVPKGFREEIVGLTLQKSTLWDEVHILTLSENMRLNRNDEENVRFATYLNEVGTNPNEAIELPPAIRKCKGINELIQEVYPQLHMTGMCSSNFLTERTILSARNDDVNDINAEALRIFPGSVVSYQSADRNSEADQTDPIMANRYPVEFLNTLNPPGIPAHDLQLKIGCPIILLRNIAPREGLCNGTRLKVVRCASRIIEAEILTGDKAGNLVFIPRISLTPSSSELTIPITRRQFPIRLAFAMTINKSQGQSVKFVGIDLRTPVFSHGQLRRHMHNKYSVSRSSSVTSTPTSPRSVPVIQLDSSVMSPRTSPRSIPGTLLDSSEQFDSDSDSLEEYVPATPPETISYAIGPPDETSRITLTTTPYATGTTTEVSPTTIFVPVFHDDYIWNDPDFVDEAFEISDQLQAAKKPKKDIVIKQEPPEED